MKKKSVTLNMDWMQQFLSRIARVGGMNPRILAVILIALTAVYASYDLIARISAAADIPKVKQTVNRTAQREMKAADAEKKAPDAYRVIAARNLFGSTDKESAGPGQGKYSAVNQAEATNLQLTLMGTIAGSDENSRAVIDAQGQKKPRVFKIGDQVGNAVVVKILRHSVVLNVGGREEVLAMKLEKTPDTGPVLNNSGPPLPRLPLDRTPAGASVQPGTAGGGKELLAMTQARPHFEGGKMDGFYMGNIAEGNLLRRFGLQTGDIVEGINDLNFQKPEDIKQLQSLNFSPGQKNVIRVKRQGRSMTLNVD